MSVKSGFKFGIGLVLAVIFLAIIGFMCCLVLVVLNMMNEATITAPPSPTPTPSLSDQILDHEDVLSPSYVWGQSAKIESLEITPTQYEISQEYTLKRGEIVTPSPGAAFLWVFVTVNNTGDNANDPIFIFELYYRGKTIDDTTFGHIDNDPVNRPSFRAEKLYPGQGREGWILFKVPKAIELSDAYFLIRPLHPEYTAWRFK
jgi:hypothetical protein